MSGGKAVETLQVDRLSPRPKATGGLHSVVHVIAVVPYTCLQKLRLALE
jgi:hypothetical protein